MRGRPEDRTLATIDDALARLTRVFPAVAVLIARQRVNLTQADIRELQEIVESAALAREALAAFRRDHQERNDA